MLRCGGFCQRLALLLASVCLVGCGPRHSEQPKAPVEDRLYKLGSAYLRACHRLHRAPRNFDEIRPDVEAKDRADELLRSPRDSEPFVIFWGVDFSRLPPNPKDPFTVAGYEKQGAGGTRYVLRFPLGVVEMDNNDLKKAIFPAGHSSP